MSPVILLGAALVATAAPLAWWSVAGQRGFAGDAGAALRRGVTVTDPRTAALAAPARERLVGPAIEAMANRARRLTPAGMLERLETRIASAGLIGRWSIETLLAAKLFFAVVVGMLGLLRLVSSPGLLSIALAAALPLGAWILPDVILGQRADDRRRRLGLELPDVMDQVTIAVEAGLGFEAALARVAQGGSGVLHAELSRTLQDIRLGMPRAEALANMAQRADTPEFRHFVNAISQAERYGLPIANVLRVQSTELREKRRQRAEEQAMKLPVKILFPLVFCILPALFIVILGPAAIRIMDGGLAG